MGYNFEFVYMIDQSNTPHFVMNRCFTEQCGSYRADIYLPNKSYSVTDLFLTDEVEEEGEYLPHVKEKEWREFFTAGPSADVEIILREAGLADFPVSKLVFVWVSSDSPEELGGFVVSAEGVQNFSPAFLEQALSCTGTEKGSAAEQEDILVDWVVEQVQNGHFPPRQE